MYPPTPAIKESPTRHTHLAVTTKHPTVTVLVNSPTETEPEHKAFRP